MVCRGRSSDLTRVSKPSHQFSLTVAGISKPTNAFCEQVSQQRELLRILTVFPFMLWQISPLQHPDKTKVGKFYEAGLKLSVFLFQHVLIKSQKYKFQFAATHYFSICNVVSFKLFTIKPDFFYLIFITGVVFCNNCKLLSVSDIDNCFV